MGRRALPTTRPLSGEPPRESHALLLTLGASAPQPPVPTLSGEEQHPTLIWGASE